MTEAATHMHPGWEPDEMLVDAALCGRLAAEGLDEPDRCYVVAGLTARKVSAPQIAELLRCSERTVHHIRAKELTVTLLRMLGLQQQMEKLARALESAHATHRRRSAELCREVDRLKARQAEAVEQMRRLRSQPCPPPPQCPPPVIVMRPRPARRRKPDPGELMEPLF